MLIVFYFHGSFEREVYVIPNSIFSKNIVLNISRRAKEYRFREDLCIRVQDVDKVSVRGVLVLHEEVCMLL